MVSVEITPLPEAAKRYAKYLEHMASGFITLPDGTDWSSRWTGYDAVLEIIMLELKNDGDEGILKEWIKYILPNENNGDIESGYCFYKKGSENILRIIDTRLMKPNFQKIFWDKVKSLTQKLDAEQSIGFLINQLNNCYESSIRNSYMEPDNLDLKEIFFVSDFKIGI